MSHKNEEPAQTTLSRYIEKQKELAEVSQKLEAARESYRKELAQLCQEKCDLKRQEEEVVYFLKI